MSRETFTLTYLNEDDRAFGLAGMAISLAAFDAIDRVASVSLDTDGPMVNFTHAYYFTGSPSMSPKRSWDIMVRNFNLTTAMAISNVLARALVRAGIEVPDDTLTALYREVETEGKESLDLEQDEVSALFRKNLSYARRIFGNQRLHAPIRDLARTISLRRTLSGTDIREELELLQII
ncbi:MAG: hypothetical protein HDS82_04640 [Bacteroidales bacterium]|nr:hypothetical protein [Bacteroidales bacterium]